MTWLDILVVLVILLGVGFFISKNVKVQPGEDHESFGFKITNLKTFYFRGIDQEEVDLQINEWLGDNPGIEVARLTQKLVQMEDGEVYLLIMIFYNES